MTASGEQAGAAVACHLRCLHVLLLCVCICRFDASKHPLPFMMAATLDTFLRIVSPALCTRVGVPLYISTLRLVASEVVPKLDVSTGMLQLERKGLVEFLEAALDQGQGGDIPLFHELK